MRHRLHSAFTLIELLIVVAIIAILAAIAVPNFLEAQTRSKVSRTLADMRSLATALEAYAVDYNNYPPSPNWHYGEEAMSALTTPVAFISSIPIDPFRDEAHLYGLQQVNPPQAGSQDRFYVDRMFIPRAFGYFSLRPSEQPPNTPPWCRQCFECDYARFTGVAEALEVTPNACLGLVNPLGRFVSSEIGWQLRSLGPSQSDIFSIPYDPTNGTISAGNIARFGPQNVTLGN